MTTEPDTQPRLHARIKPEDLARIKRAHARTYERHGLSFSAWAVRVLLSQAAKTEKAHERSNQ